MIETIKSRIVNELPHALHILEKLNLNLLGSSFVIRVNLLHP